MRTLRPTDGPDVAGFVPPSPARHFDAVATKALVVGLAAAVCFGCGSGQTRVTAAESTPTLLVHDVEGRGDDAEIVGRLRYLGEADCFVLESQPEVGRLVRNVAVWPPGTEVWREDTNVAGVQVPDLGRISLGSQVVGAGGYANANTPDIDLPDVPSDCLTQDGEFAMLHMISEADPA